MILDMCIPEMKRGVSTGNILVWYCYALINKLNSNNNIDEDSTNLPLCASYSVPIFSCEVEPNTNSLVCCKFSSFRQYRVSFRQYRVVHRSTLNYGC
jgi:hypothetical protein